MRYPRAACCGLDHGTKTIGTAFCDSGWHFASPGKTLPRGKFARDKTALELLIAERGVAGIVIGLPLNMDGSEGPRAQAARAFCPQPVGAGPADPAGDERSVHRQRGTGLIEQDMSRAKRAERDRSGCSGRDPAGRD
ncbi:MAG: Holliday junction resolvase RuvX [Caenibius sp.]